MKTIEFKLILKSDQIKTIESWMRTCCWIYNKAIEMRTKSWKRRKESISLYDQQKWLTKIRARNSRVSSVPCLFARNSLKRVDQSFLSFFKRCKSGTKPGFPRFRSSRKYNVMEILEEAKYLKNKSVYIPKIGFVKILIGNQEFPETQKLLRVIRRASGWYGQVVVEECTTINNLEDHGAVGIDVGLESFATMSDGSKIKNPRFYCKSEKKLKRLQKSLSRKKKCSRNRLKAVVKLKRQHEKISMQRRNFCHQRSTDLVRKHPIIAVEKLNINGMIKNRRFSKSISDAGWGIFTLQLKVKAENAGRLVVEVNPAGTSQECPDCGSIKKKKLSERVHRCNCGCVLDRDVAASRVILDRALVATGATRLWRDSTSGSLLVAGDQADPMKQELPRFSG